MVPRSCVSSREYLHIARTLARLERGSPSRLNHFDRAITPQFQADRRRAYGTATRRPPPPPPSTTYRPAVWTVSPINTGNPIYDEPISSTTSIPLPEVNSTPQQPISNAEYDPLAPWISVPWSTSLCNTGNPNFDFDQFLNDVESAVSSDPKMSDADYEAFLNKASADASGSAPAKSQSSSDKTQTVNTSEVHPALKSVKTTYTSDTDSEFQPVSLSLSKGKGSKISEEDFAKITGIAKQDVEVMNTGSFDPRGQYKSVLQAVTQAADADAGSVQIFRIEKGGARCEYWILAAHDTKGERKAVGFKVDAVES